MATSWRSFLLAFVGVCFLFGSVLGFVVVAKYDYHCTYDGPAENPQGNKVVYYEQLSPEERALFHRMLEHPGATFTDEQCATFGDRQSGAGALVRYEGSYYEVGNWRSFHWTDPAMLAVVAAFLAGGGVLYAAATREMRRKPW